MKSVFKEGIDLDIWGNFDPTKWIPKPEIKVEGQAKAGLGIQGKSVFNPDFIKQQEDTLSKYESDYETLDKTIEEDYKQYVETEKQLEQLQIDLQEAPEEMIWNKTQKFNQVRDLHNSLVDKLKTNTAEQKKIYDLYTTQRSKYEKDTTPDIKPLIEGLPMSKPEDKPKSEIESVTGYNPEVGAKETKELTSILQNASKTNNQAWGQWFKELKESKDKWSFIQGEGHSPELQKLDDEAIKWGKLSSESGVNSSDWVRTGVYATYATLMATEIIPILSQLPANILNKLTYKVEDKTVKGKELLESLRRVSTPSMAGFGEPSELDKAIYDKFVSEGAKSVFQRMSEGIKVSTTVPRFAFGGSTLYSTPVNEMVKVMAETGKIGADIAKELSLAEPELVSKVIQDLSIASPVIASKLAPELVKLIPQEKAEPAILPEKELTEKETTPKVDTRPFAKLLDLDKLANDTYEIKPSDRAEGTHDIFFKGTDKLASKFVNVDIKTAQNVIDNKITDKIRKVFTGEKTPEKGEVKLRETFKEYLKQPQPEPVKVTPPVEPKEELKAEGKEPTIPEIPKEEERLKIGDLVKWNGDNSGRIDKITHVIGGTFGGVEYMTEETNPKTGQEPKIGKQFWDRFGEYKDRGVGLEKIGKAKGKEPEGFEFLRKRLPFIKELLSEGTIQDTENVERLKQEIKSIENILSKAGIEIPPEPTKVEQAQEPTPKAIPAELEGLAEEATEQTSATAPVAGKAIGEATPTKAEVKAEPTKPPVPPSPPTTQQKAEEPMGDPVAKLNELIKQAKPKRGRLETEYTKERARRIAEVERAIDEIGGEQGYIVALSKLKGQLAPGFKFAFEPVKDKLSKPEIDALYNRTFKHPYLNEWEKISAANELTKILSGELPTPKGLVLLEEIYGTDLIKSILAKRALGLKVTDFLIDVANIPRAILATADMSGFLRQGVVYVASHPVIAANAMGKTFKFALSPKSFEQYFKDLPKDKLYPLMRKSDLAITDPSKYSVSGREEAFMSRLMQKIPIVGQVMRFAERSYVGFLTKLRVDVFKTFADEFLSRGFSPVKDIELFKSTADVVNTFTGRGNLGKFNRIAPVLNNGFFSPRLIMARFNALNPIWYARQPKEIRVKAIKDFAKFVAAGLTLLVIIKASGLGDVETNPRSSDFGKIKIGNTRWDIWGGFIQWVRVFAQLITGERKNTATGEIISLSKEDYPFTTRKEVLLRFIEGKLAPVPALVNELISGAKTFEGEDITFETVVKEKFIPMYIQDIADAYMDGGFGRATGSGVAAFFGVGVQTWQEKTTKIKINTKDLYKKIGIGIPNLYKKELNTLDLYKKLGL